MLSVRQVNAGYGVSQVLFDVSSASSRERS